jgi:hypothetical protein
MSVRDDDDQPQVIQLVLQGLVLDAQCPQLLHVVDESLSIARFRVDHAKLLLDRGTTRLGGHPSLFRFLPPSLPSLILPTYPQLIMQSLAGCAGQAQTLLAGFQVAERAIAFAV